MTKSDHINSVTRSCFYQLRQLSFVRRFLSADSSIECLFTRFLAVNYCNSLLYDAGAHITHKHQAVLNAPARLITGVGRYDHLTPVLRDILHWLPVNQRIIYQIALLLYKCLHGTGPAYLKDYCITLFAEDLHHHLRSIARGDNVIVHSTTRTRRLGPRSFGSSGLTVWNSLPLSVRNAQSLAQFKKTA